VLGGTLLEYDSQFWSKDNTSLRGDYSDHVQVHIIVFSVCDMSPCFNVQKALYLSHTTCAAAPLFTLCLKPEPSLL